MINYMLYRLTKRSNMMMANMFRTHVEFTPNEELLNGTEVDEVLELYPRPTETCKVYNHHIFYLKEVHCCTYATSKVLYNNRLRAVRIQRYLPLKNYMTPILYCSACNIVIRHDFCPICVHFN